MINRFSLLKQDGKARLGRYQTTHGIFETPNFMPVGTKATVKGIDVERLKEAGTQITLVNTYHLWLRPSSEKIQKLGGIHKFCGFSGPILSDSGGFQVFSLNSIRKLSEDGVEFRSHIDGAKCFLSPERSMVRQAADTCARLQIAVPPWPLSAQRQAARRAATPWAPAARAVSRCSFPSPPSANIGIGNPAASRAKAGQPSPG